MKDHKTTIFDVNEGILVAYVTHRAKNNIKFTSIKQDLFAIQSIMFDLNISIKMKNYPILEKVLLGIKKTSQPSQQVKLEITPELLKKIFSFLPQKTHYETQVYRSAFTVAVFGMLRCGEFANETEQITIKTLRLHHIERIEDKGKTKMIRIFIPVSKSDIFRQGVHIHLPCLCIFSTQCPVHETIKMIELREKLNITMDPMSPLFIFSNKKPLQKLHVSKLLNKLPIQPIVGKHKFTGHSFRRGGATALAENGTPDWIIQMLGRWKSESYKKYIGCQPSQICEYVKQMLGGLCSTQ